MLAHLAAAISQRKTHHTFRFLFAPGTIGAITWLATHAATAHRIKHGLVVSCIGDRGGVNYKRTRHGNAVVDRAVLHTLRHRGVTANVHDFEPYGYDERQYSSPGFNLPVGLFQRSKFAAFPEYHTSADNLGFVSPDDLAKSYEILAAAIDVIDRNHTLRNLQPYCEPQLGRRGLFTAIGGDKNGPAKSMAMLWVLNLSDGDHSLLDIAERANMPFDEIAAAADLLEAHGLLAGFGA